MGDRASIAVKYSSGDTVYLYGHWIGEQVVDIVETAMATSGRVTDESYFARVLFSKMVTSNGTRDIDSETGYGIAPYLVDHDAGNPLVWVDYTRSDDKGIPEVYIER